MKKMYGVFAVLCLSLILGASAINAKTVTVKKSGAKITVKEKSSVTVKLAGKALKKVKNSSKSMSVKSANKKIATVKQTKAQKKKYSFTVKGVKKGNTVITAKYKKNAVKVKVSVTSKASDSITAAPIVTLQPNQDTQPTPVVQATERPLRTRIEVPESDAETRGDYSKVTSLSTYSTNGEYVFNIWKDASDKYYYNVVCEDTEVVEVSSLGLMLSDTDLTNGLICDPKDSYVDEIYEEFETITLANATSLNHCQERTIKFSNKDGATFDLLVRVYNDGIAYKYANVTFGSGDDLVCTEENSTIVFPRGTTTWGGLAWINTCENGFDKKEYNSFYSGRSEYHPPLLANVEDFWIVTSEAQIFNNNGEFCRSRLAKDANSAVLRWDFGDARDETIPLEQQAKNDNTTLDLVNVKQKDIKEVETVNGFSTPWRAMVISNDFNEYCTSSMITNLNPPSSESKYADVYEDISWIKPGKVLWSWWSDGNNQGNYNTHKNYIDMASEYGFDYVCLDVGWRSFENRLPELCEYAASKNVKVFCWVNYWELTTAEDIDELFGKWADAGAVGVKTDYFEGEEQFVLNSMENIAVIGAKYHFMVLYHGCIAPGGESRTYPNILTTEAVLGEENRIWSQSPSSYNCLIYPFARNILGSMDYTPACKTIKNMIGETEGFAMAKTIIYESGLLHLAAPAAEYRNYVGLPFLQDVYTTWDQSMVPSGEASPGEYLTYVRRKGDEFFIGSMTIPERTMKVSLDFLPEGENYVADIYYADSDGKLKVMTEEYTKADTFTFDLAKQDGLVAYLRKK